MELPWVCLIAKHPLSCRGNTRTIILPLSPFFDARVYQGMQSQGSGYSERRNGCHSHLQHSPRPKYLAKPREIRPREVYS